MKHVLAIVGYKGDGYGQGHYLRMKFLQKYLYKKNIQLKIIIQSHININKQSSQYHALNKQVQSELTKNIYSLIILDAKDEAFPSICLYYPIPSMCLDNQGLGRQQADITWDILPHPTMNNKELQTSFKNILISHHIIKLRKSTDIYLSDHTYIHNNITHNNLLTDNLDNSFDFVSLYKKKKHLPLHQYIKILSKATTVISYFGNTTFESIFLRKNIILQDISSYHKTLNYFLIKALQNNSTLLSLYTGDGYSRLINKIQSHIF